MASVATTLVVPVFAQDTLKITVTGTRSPRPVDTFPGSIEVFEKDDLDNKPGYTIKELFNQIPGVTTKSVKRNGVVGPTDAGTVNIRGLDFKRILFLIDGSRLPDSYKFAVDGGSRQYYTMSQGGYVDFNTLSALEITKGPASALYGSDALGGIIAYRTLVPEDLLKGDKETAFETPVNYNSANDGLSGSIKFASKLTDKTSVILVYTKEDAKEYKVKADSKYIDNENHTGNNYFGKVVQKIGDYGEGSLSYENVDRNAEIKVKSDNLIEMNSPRYGITYLNLTENTKRYRDKITGQYKFDNPDANNFLKYFSVKGYSQYARVNDDMDRKLDSYVSPFSGAVVPVRTENLRYYLKNDSLGGEIELKSNLNDNHQLTYGLDYSEADISRLRTTFSTYEETEIVKDTPDTNIKRTGIFLQDEFSLEKFDFIAGIRYDNYELDAKTDSYVTKAEYANDFSDDNFSPKVAVTYNFNDNFSGYASYSRGFRAPAYYEFNGNFENASRGYRILPNPNLKSETSDGYEVGLRGNTNKSNFKLSTFINKYKNFIQQFNSGASTDTTGTFRTDYVSQNVEKAEIKGYEFSYKYFLNDNRKGINLFTNLAYSEGDNTTDNVPLTSVNPFEIKYGVGFKSANNKFSSKLTNTHVGKARVAADTTTFVPDAYTVTDLELAYAANKTSEFTAGVYNIFDNTYYNYQDVQGQSASLSNLTKYTQPGTHFRVGFKFSF